MLCFQSRKQSSDTDDEILRPDLRFSSHTVREDVVETIIYVTIESLKILCNILLIERPV